MGSFVVGVFVLVVIGLIVLTVLLLLVVVVVFIRALLFRVYIRAPEFTKRPYQEGLGVLQDVVAPGNSCWRHYMSYSPHLGS